DPHCQKFRLLENPNTIFVIREPSSITNLNDGSGALKAQHLNLETDHQQDKTSNIKMVAKSLDGPGLYHPILGHPQELSTPTAIRTVKSLLLLLRKSNNFKILLDPETLLIIQILRQKALITGLSRKFGV
ncbi:hypothetical protein BY996DRAFT_4582674, partial [Phakopsora pachyrhizi]